MLSRKRRQLGRDGTTAARALLTAVLFACSGSEITDAPWFERAQAEPFRGVSEQPQPSAFDALGADMDGDGDVDLLVNWHHLAPLELFENQGGFFERVSDSGLYDNRGVPTLFAESSQVLPSPWEREAPALYLWHASDPRGSWNFHWNPRSTVGDELRIVLQTSTRFAGLEGLDASEHEWHDERTLAVTITAGAGQRRFQVRSRRVAEQLIVDFGEGSSPPPVLIGPDRVAWRGQRLELWKEDPHGAAWVDVEGSLRPELYLTRGALVGRLRPPRPPKVDRYFLPGGALERPYRLVDRGVVPADYGRGRRVEWVDVDNDGTAELSISNKRTPNALLFRDAASGAFADRAAEHGIDFVDAEVTTWGDFDGDRREDLFYLTPAGVSIALNREGAPFRSLAPGRIGLSLAELPIRKQLFQRASLRLADLDNDGDLDLWLLAYGGRSFLFRRERGRFVDVSADLGLGELEKHRLVVLLDIDNDGYEDAVSFGKGGTVWKNQGGERFSFHPLRRELLEEVVHAGCALDADGDGRGDVALFGGRRHLLRNVAGQGNRYLEVLLASSGGAPVGAVVRARFSDGSVAARRYGSADNTIFSQSLQPLRFGVAEGAELVEIGVQWPGAIEEERRPVDRLNERLWIVEEPSTASQESAAPKRLARGSS